jgi:hypothetical protein
MFYGAIFALWSGFLRFPRANVEGIAMALTGRIARSDKQFDR